jgi:hypothetical protein
LFPLTSLLAIKNFQNHFIWEFLISFSGRNFPQEKKGCSAAAAAAV